MGQEDGCGLMMESNGVCPPDGVLMRVKLPGGAGRLRARVGRWAVLATMRGGGWGRRSLRWVRESRRGRLHGAS